MNNINKTLRWKLYSFVRSVIFKIKEGERMNKFLLIFRFILFPFKSIKYSIISQFYDCMTDSYTIEGVKISAFLFRELGNKENTNHIFQLLNIANGIMTVRRFNTYQMHIIPFQIPNPIKEPEIIKKQYVDFLSKGISINPNGEGKINE